MQADLAAYLNALRSKSPIESILSTSSSAQIVPKEKIAANGDYNLSGERYREDAATNHSFPILPLGEIAELQLGKMLDKEKHKAGKLMPYLRNVNVRWGSIDTDDLSEMYFEEDELERFGLRSGDVLVCEGGEPGRAAVWNGHKLDIKFQKALHRVRFKTPFEPHLFVFLLQELARNGAIASRSSGTSIKHLTREVFHTLPIPVPPLEVQKEIVAEIEGYQKVINGARAVLDNYRPHIPIHSDWPMVELGEICDINPDTVSPTSDYPGQTVFYVDISAVENESGRFLGYTEVLSSDAPSRARRGVQPKDILLSTVRPNLKAFTILRQVRERTVVSTGFAVLRAKLDLIDPGFLFEAVRLGASISQMVGMSGRGAYPSINQSDVAAIKIPLPPLATQQTIVAEIEAEQSLVAANRELIARFEKKIQTTLTRVWGEEVPGATVGSAMEVVTELSN